MQFDSICKQARANQQPPSMHRGIYPRWEIHYGCLLSRLMGLARGGGWGGGVVWFPTEKWNWYNSKVLIRSLNPRQSEAPGQRGACNFLTVWWLTCWLGSFEVVESVSAEWRYGWSPSPPIIALQGVIKGKKNENRCSSGKRNVSFFSK